MCLQTNRNDIIKALRKEYQNSLFEYCNGSDIDANDYRLTTIENIADEIGVLKELQENW